MWTVVVEIRLCANWGAEKWVGLTGLELIDSHSQPLTTHHITTETEVYIHSHNNNNSQHVCVCVCVCVTGTV